MRKILAAIVLAGAVAVVAPGTARAAVTPAVAVEIKAAHSNLCLNVDHALTTNDAAILQYSCGYVNDQFRVVPKGSDTYQIIVGYSGKCLNVYKANDANNTPVHQYTCSDTATNNLWRFVPVPGRTTFRIVSVKSGKCLNVYQASTALGTAVNIYGCTTSALNDQFYFPPAASGAAAPQPVQPDTPPQAVQGVAGGPLVYGYTDNTGLVWRLYQQNPDDFGNVSSTPAAGFGSTAGYPALAVRADGRVQMAARSATDGDLVLSTETLAGGEAFSAGQDVGGSPGTQPVTGLPDGSSRQLVSFAIVGGGLWHLPQDGTHLPYGQWRYIGGSGLTGEPALSLTPNGFRVYALNASGDLLTAVYEGGVLSDFTNLGGAGLVTGTPVVLTLPGYHARVVMRTTDGGIVSKLQPLGGDFPADWKRVPGVSAAGRPAVIIDPPTGRTVVIVRGTDGTVYATVETGQVTDVFGDWQQATPTVVTSDPTILPYRHANGVDTWAYVARDGYQLYVVTTGQAAAAARSGTAPLKFTRHALPKG